MIRVRPVTFCNIPQYAALKTLGDEAKLSTCVWRKFDCRGVSILSFSLSSADVWHCKTPCALCFSSLSLHMLLTPQFCHTLENANPGMISIDDFFYFKSWWNRNSEILSQQPCCSNLLLRHSSPLLLLSLVKAHLLLTPLQAATLLSSPLQTSMLLSSIQASLLLRSLCSSLMPKLLCSSSCQEVKCWLDYILNILQTKKNKWHMCPDKIDHWWCLMYLWRSL